MNDLIVIENESPILSADAAQKIHDFEVQAQLIKKQEDELKAAILAEMERKRIYKIDSDILSITYIAETSREVFDSKAFRAEFPMVYDDFVKLSTVKPSVRIKVKA